MKTFLRKTAFIVLILILLSSQLNVIYGLETTYSPDPDNITITNNAGLNDNVTVTNLYGGETIRIYNAPADGKVLKTVNVSQSRTEVSISITQLGAKAGSVYITFAFKGELESSRTKVDYSAEKQSDKLDTDSIFVTNNSGRADTVTITGLYGGEAVRIYNAATAGKLIGSGNVPMNKTEANINITQVGSEGGSIFVSVKNKGEMESDRVEVVFDPEPKSAPPNIRDISITNNAGINDTIYVGYLSTGDTVNVYNAARGGILLGKAAVPYGKTDVTISISQMGKADGSVYISIATKGFLESERIKVDYSAEDRAGGLSESNVTIANNAGSSDTINITCLSDGDTVKVYRSASGSLLLGTATVKDSSGEVEIKVAQLGSQAGTVYISVSSQGKYESKRLPVSYEAESSSDSISSYNITITNNSGRPDTIRVTNLAGGDLVKVYNSAAGGSMLGKATAPASGAECTVSISQLGSGSGTVYVTVTAKGKTESARCRADYPAEPVTDKPSEYSIEIINNPSGRDDTVNVFEINSGDIVRVYDSQTEGRMLGTGKVPDGQTQLSVSISQLGTGAGSVYVTVTGKDMNESGRVKADYAAEAKTGDIDAGSITVTNNVAGTDDIVEVTGLSEGDTVKVYSALAGGRLLGTETAESGDSGVVVKISQLGVAPGKIYVSITGANKLESDREEVSYPGESSSRAPAAENIHIINNAGASDIVEVTGLNDEDTVKVYDAERGGKLLGQKTAGAYETYVRLEIPQLGIKAGSVYITLTGANSNESGRTKADYAEEAASDQVDEGSIRVTNNAGSSDIVVVSGLNENDLVKVYDSAAGGALLGSATATQGTVAVVSVAQLGSSAGSVYVSVTGSNRLESPRVKADYFEEAKSSAPDTGDISITNNVGNSDIICVYNVSDGDAIKVYDAEAAGTVLGTATAGIYDTSVTIQVVQLGSSAGGVYVTKTSRNMRESGRTRAEYSSEERAAPVAAEDISVINNAGMADILTVQNLSGGETVTVYDSEMAGQILGTATAGEYESSVVLNITQLGTAAGNVYVTRKEDGKMESVRIRASYDAEQSTPAPADSTIEITNNAGISDTVAVRGLSGTETVKVYDSAAGGSLLGTAAGGAYDSSVTVVIDQLGTSAGTVYVTVTRKGFTESARTPGNYSEEPRSSASDMSNVIIHNNAGAPDTIQINGLNGGDTVYVYSRASGGTLLGSADAGPYDTHITVTVPQLGAAAGNAYVSIKSVGKLESARIEVPYAAEQKTDAPWAGNITVHNYSGMSDEIIVTYLDSADLVKVYTAASGGTLLGSGTVNGNDTEVNVKIPQLGTSSGTVYISVTGANKHESDRTPVVYQEEEVTDIPDSSNIIIANNAKMADTVTVLFLEEGDTVCVYSAASGGKLLGTAIAEEEENRAVVSITQLGSAEGSVYVSATGAGKQESGRVRVNYLAEQKSEPLSSYNITVKNNAGMPDTVTVSFLDEEDVIKVYASAAGSALLDSAIVPAGYNEVTIKISQLGTAAGSLYLTVTSSGKLESDRACAYYTAEPVSDAPDAGQISITNNSGRSDTIIVDGLVEGDIVKVYNAAVQGSMLGYATCPDGYSSVTVRVPQLGTMAGVVHISITSAGAAESSRTAAGYPAE